MHINSFGFIVYVYAVGVLGVALTRFLQCRVFDCNPV